LSEEKLGFLAYEHHKNNDLIKAQKYYEKLLKINSKRFDICNNLGVIYQSQGDLHKAQSYYEKALLLNPFYVDVLNNLGTLYKVQNNLPSAQSYYEKALELSPNNASLYSNLGALYKIKGDLHVAKNYYKKALSIDAKHIDALNNLTLIYKWTNDLQKAEICANKVIEIDSNNADAYNNLGVIYKENNDLEKAGSYYKKAIELDPTSVDTLLNISLLHLLQKEYEKGFALYRYRYHKYDLYINTELVKNMRLIQSLEEAKGKKILVSFEQGFGDAIQFIRFASLLRSVNAEFSFYIQEPLQRIFSYNFPDISFVGSDAVKEFSYYFPIMDASYLLGLTYENIPNKEGYLKVDEKDVREFILVNGLETDLKKIGFAFKGSHLHQNDANRSIELLAFIKGILPLQEDTKLYSLQYGLDENEKKLLQEYAITDLGSKIENFYDTAVMALCMDSIITVDSSLLHVSGALAKKSYLLLPFAPDWRWGIDDSTTNWYDSVKIYRQKRITQWSDVFEAVVKDILDEL
jgi:Flp pilus assembly protein TadD